MREIDLLFFARLREVLGVGHERLSLPETVRTVADLMGLLCQREGKWAEELGGKRLFRVAINQEMASLDAEIPAGAEVAIFPPVTGG
ncbi:molybdopterin converting factor subunit 1 [Parachitinimonas caeni]|uniref:Molybdopterin synthase sulfur carrier subunit n=1 Tax=Parachitinimonas caeni TaxID=3031301 RepID=A0ABT7DWN0_9NEIS|nr:molybdopterin converting factor subunit 1 [Parachitinimonas caeni]MDK2124436.1 molybdopterin converting factor subunit 1 [Parachitinimonas caeni]